MVSRKKVGFYLLLTLLSNAVIHTEIIRSNNIVVTHSDTSQVDKVLFIENKKQREIPHVTLTQLVDAANSHIIDRRWYQKLNQSMGDTTRSHIVVEQDKLGKSWRTFYAGQTLSHLGAGSAFIVNYINEDSLVAFKKRETVEKIIKKMNVISPLHYKIAISSVLLSLAAYPLIRYFNFFCLKNLDFYYLSEEIESNILVFRKKTFSHSVTRGNTTTFYFNISDPIGYMTKEEKEKEFKVVTTANRYFHLSLLNAALCTGIVTWALLRE